MNLFSVLENSDAILRLNKGLFQQVKLYKRGKEIYAPFSGKFIQIKTKNADGSFVTSHPDIKLIEYECEEIEEYKNKSWTKLRIVGT